MIVSPDFLDDWKMTVLGDALGRDPLAPVYVLRLWAHCQQKKAWQFAEIPALTLKSICRAPHDGRTFFDAMVEASYVEPLGAGFSVQGWADLNGQLIAAWTNGRNGGRPPSPPKPNGKPSGNPTPPPTATRGKPTGKPIREDKINPRASGDAPPPLPPAPPPEPKKKPVEAPEAPAAPTPAPPPPSAAPGPAAPPAGPKPRGMDLFGDDDQPGRKPKPRVPEPESAAGFPCPEGVSPGIWGEWLAYRLTYSAKNKKAPFTATAMRGVINTYLKRCIATGESGDDALQRAMAQGWSAPYPDPQLERAAQQRRGLPVNGIRQSQRDIDAERGRALAGEPPSTRGATHEATGRRTGDIEDVEWRDKPPATGE